MWVDSVLYSDTAVSRLLISACVYNIMKYNLSFLKFPIAAPHKKNLNYFVSGKK